MYLVFKTIIKNSPKEVIRQDYIVEAVTIDKAKSTLLSELKEKEPIILSASVAIPIGKVTTKRKKRKD